MKPDVWETIWRALSECHAVAGSLFGDVKTGLQKLAGNDRLINAQEGQVRMEIAALGESLCSNLAACYGV